jgi:hypothetical protein
MKLKVWHILILLLLKISFCNAQSYKDFLDNKSIGASYHYGFLLPEYTYHQLQAISAINGVEINLGTKLNGKNYWQNLYNYPVSGISMYYSGLSNKELYGNVFSVYAYSGSSFFPDRKIQLTWRLGLGFCYVGKKFHLEDNLYNISVGSHINMLFRGELGWETKITDRFDFRQNLAFNHFSNANMAEPNIGLNWLNFQNAIVYYPKARPQINSVVVPNHSLSVKHRLILSGGLKHTKSFESYQYITSSLAYSPVFSISHLVSVGPGADLFYDSSVKTIFERRERDFKPHFAWQSGLHINFIMYYNRMGFGLQQGIYLGLIDEVAGNKAYNRAFIEFFFNKNLHVVLALKTHLHILDHVQLGIGINIKDKSLKQ